MKRVLFLCTGNSARSQMAEALLRSIAGDQYKAYSAGTDIAPAVNPFALEVLGERGADTEGLHSKILDIFMDQSFDLIITVCDNAKQTCPFFPGAKSMGHWSLEDPAAFEGTREETLLKFRKSRDEIERRIRTALLT
ncbi:MAG: arsenate reductase ArsC [Candidatus Thorarchaeota archaeon]